VDGGDIESDVRRLCDAGQFERAAARAIEAYGPEIGRFISGRVRNDADAQEVFSIFCEDLWVGIRDFAWRCTFRGWAYTLARHGELRHMTSPQRRRERNLTLSQITAAAFVRTSTPGYQRMSRLSRNVLVSAK
jgi:RNA polymerase sigma-70 factor (ECF subfamily)